MVRLIIDEHIPFIKGVFESYCDVIYATGGKIDRSVARDADGMIIRTRTKCDAALLEDSKVKFIASATVGFDHIDIDYCHRNGISWHHAPGCNASSVTQYMGSALCILAKRGGFDLQGKTIGIIGAGHVGSRLANLASTFGMEVLLNDPPRAREEGPAGFVTLDEIQHYADIISLHVPLNYEGKDKTYHLADHDFIAALKRMPYLINTARGPVADTRAIKYGLKKGWLAGYVADVWENEPLADPVLIDMADIATPHIAGYSAEGKANGTAACVRAASRFFNLGIDEWFPENIPYPDNQLIEVKKEGKKDEEILSEALMATYDILADDKAFRDNPEAFEQLRNFYPVRREPGAYRVRIPNCTPELTGKLKAIGFITKD